MPCRTMVLPVRSAMAVTNKDRINSTVDLASMPSTNSVCMYNESALTAGMVNPMLASADPSARFRLVCKRLARAARSAAKPSGSKTMAESLGLRKTVQWIPHARLTRLIIGFSCR